MNGKTLIDHSSAVSASSLKFNKPGKRKNWPFVATTWIRNAPPTEIQQVYHKLGDLVADGSLSAALERVYPLEQFKEAFEQSLKPNRNGKTLFKFGATDRTDLKN
jgi:NADPH:quinone reductase-like Zn-dependent oxidoreductase